MKYIVLFLSLVCANASEYRNLYDMIQSDSDANAYARFLYSDNNKQIENCFDDHTTEYMDKLSENKNDYLNYLKDVNNTQFLCTRNLNIVKFKEINKFKYRVIPELGLVWGYKKHIRCGGIALSNFILRCIALEFIKV